MPVWLVTGGSGFLGGHLLDALTARPDLSLIALGRNSHGIRPSVPFARADLERPETLPDVISTHRPDVIIHTAGRTPPATDEELYRGNTLATLHLLGALVRSGRATRVVLTGSAAELGPVNVSALPVSEDQPCRPATPYGMSKWLATCAGQVTGPPAEVIVARVFNIVGPGQPPSQALGRFAAAVADPSTSELKVGDIETRRDFVDVRDVARALVALAENGRAGQVYHVGTGQSRRVGDALEHFLRRRGTPFDVRVDPAHSRDGPIDSRADIRRIVRDTGWTPQIPWETSLDNLWDEAAGRLRTR